MTGTVNQTRHVQLQLNYNYIAFGQLQLQLNCYKSGSVTITITLSSIAITITITYSLGSQPNMLNQTNHFLHYCVGCVTAKMTNKNTVLTEC